MRFKRTKKYPTALRVLCFILVFAILPCAYADNPDNDTLDTLYPIRDGDLWGYMDFYGNVIIQPQWTECGIFRGGKYALVSFGWGQDGIIDTQGGYVFEPRYSIGEFEQFDYYGGKDTGVYWFFDDQDAFLDIESGYFSGFCLSPAHEVWIDNDYPFIRITFDGETYGYMNRSNGKLTIPCIFADMTNGRIHDGFVCDRIYDTDIVIVMDTLGEQLKLPDQVTVAAGEIFENDRLLVKDQETGLYGYCDSSGLLVIPASFQDAYGFYEGYAAVKIDGLWAHIDVQGKLMCQPVFGTGYSFLHQRAVINDGTLISVIDYKGNVICTFDSPTQAMHGYTEYGVTLYTDYQQMWIIDVDGNTVGNPQVYDPFIFADYQFAEGIQMFIRNGKYGYVDYRGNMISDFVWDYCEKFSDGLAYVEMDGKMAYIDYTGRVVLAEN